VIKHIRIIDSGAIRQCDLLDLGQFNVICGKNNSGKTTLLKAMIDPNKGLRGLTITPEIQESLLAKVTADLHPIDGLRTGHLRFYLDSLRDYLSGRNPWFSNDVQLLAKAEEEIHARMGPSTFFRSRSDLLGKAYLMLFSRLEPFYISPKRVLQLHSLEVSTPIGILQSGENAVSTAFMAKNQLPGSELREKWVQFSDAFREIASGIEVDVALTPNLVVNYRRKTGDWIPASEWGLGLNDLFIILAVSVFGSSELILLEEPENHMHPEMLRRLAMYLKARTDKQFAVTTHSNVLLASEIADRVYLAKCENDEISVTDEMTRAAKLNELGYSVSENLLSDMIVLVEGITDKPVVDWLLDSLEITKYHSIRVWPMHGDAMVHIDPTVFMESHKVIALVDRDPKSSRARKKFTNRCNELGIQYHRLERLAIENYLPVCAIRSVFPSIKADLDRLEPNIRVEDQIGFEVKRQNWQIVRYMSMKDVEDTDLLEFAHKVQALLNN
jgi:energy-coupling factor transporter ATP-binding protein EcfA2